MADRSAATTALTTGEAKHLTKHNEGTKSHTTDFNSHLMTYRISKIDPAVTPIHNITLSALNRRKGGFSEMTILVNRRRIRKAIIDM